MNTGLHAVTDSQGRPIQFFITAGQVSDYVGARALCGSLPAVDWLIADRATSPTGSEKPCRTRGSGTASPAAGPATKPVRYDKRRYKRRNRIKIMFGSLKDWRRTATRYDRCPRVFLSAIALAAAVIFWL